MAFMVRKVEGGTGKRIWGVETAGIPQEYEGKVKLVVYYKTIHPVMDSLGFCLYLSNWSAPQLLSPKEIAEICSAALGKDFPEEELINKGKRILILEKNKTRFTHIFIDRTIILPRYFLMSRLKEVPLKVKG